MTRPVFQVEAVISFEGNGTINNARDCSMVRNATGEYYITLSRSLDAKEMAAAIVPTLADISFSITSLSDLVKRVLTKSIPDVINPTPADTDAGCYVIIYRFAYGDS